MTESEINEQIAKACGWHNICPNPIVKNGLAGTRLNERPRDNANPLLGIPDYCGDLNAMRDAEETLFDAKDPMDGGYLHYESMLDGLIRPWHAAAYEKAAIFLMVKGLWKKD